MHFLCLRGRGGHTGTDGPHRLVSDDHFLHLLGRQAEEHGSDLFADHVEVVSFLAFSEFLTDAVDDLQAVFKGQGNLRDEFFSGFAIIFATLGVAEDRIGAAGVLEHGSGHFACEGTFRLVGAVLGGEGHGATFQNLGDRGQVGERRGDDERNALRYFIYFGDDGFCQFNSFGDGGIHLPVASYDFLSHWDGFITTCKYRKKLYFCGT